MEPNADQWHFVWMKRFFFRSASHECKSCVWLYVCVWICEHIICFIFTSIVTEYVFVYIFRCVVSRRSDSENDELKSTGLKYIRGYWNGGNIYRLPDAMESWSNADRSPWMLIHNNKRRQIGVTTPSHSITLHAANKQAPNYTSERDRTTCNTFMTWQCAWYRLCSCIRKIRVDRVRSTVSNKSN